MRFLLLTFLCLGLISETAFASGKNIDLGGMRVTLWEPKTEGKAPIIIFSHGFHGCSTQSSFLMEAMADDGYIVFAPNHADAVCNGGPSRWVARPQSPFGKPQRWTDNSFFNRHEDIVNLIAVLKADSKYSDRIDWSRMALAGHSLGGYTALALSNGRQKWKIEGVKAILALSPYTPALNNLKHLSAPVMYQGGTRDTGITPFVRKKDGAYDQSPKPKYYVEFRGATHFAWTDGSRIAHVQIIRYSLAFLDHYLKAADGEVLTQKENGVSALRYDSELGEN